MLCQIWTTHTHTAGYWSPVNKSCVCVCVSVQWETVMTSSTGGGGTSSGERGATWSGQERERRGGGTTGPTGELTWTHLNTSEWHVVTVWGCVGVVRVCWCCVVMSGTGTAAGRGGGTTIAGAESGFLPPDTSALSTNAWGETGECDELIWDL